MREDQVVYEGIAVCLKPVTRSSSSPAPEEKKMSVALPLARGVPLYEGRVWCVVVRSSASRSQSASWHHPALLLAPKNAHHANTIHTFIAVVLRR